MGAVHAWSLHAFNYTEITFDPCSEFWPHKTQEDCHFQRTRSSRCWSRRIWRHTSDTEKFLDRRAEDNEIPFKLEGQALDHNKRYDFKGPGNAQEITDDDYE
jgi:hypothetical protein